MVAVSPLPVRPDRAERAAALVALVGEGRETPLSLAWKAQSLELVKKHVHPILARAWPDALHGAIAQKLEVASSGYASIPLSSLVWATRRPPALRFGARVCNRLELSEGALSALATRFMVPAFRWLHRRECRRASLMSALILLLDAALDDDMEHLEPRARPRALCDVMRGAPAPANCALAAVGETGRALRAGLAPHEVASLDRVFDEIELWAEGEIANLVGVADPEGVNYRMRGIRTSMRMLHWAVEPWTSERELAYFVDVALFGQQLDDFLDIEKDLAQERETPAITGAWTLETISALYRRVHAGALALSREGGDVAPHYVRMLDDTCRAQFAWMVKILIENP